MSWRVTANFNCDTSELRRASASSERFPASHTATATSARTTATPRRSRTDVRIHHIDRLPTKSNGPVTCESVAAAHPCHATNETPSAVIDQRGAAVPCATSAVTTNSTPMIAPASAPQKAKTAMFAVADGMRRSSNWFADPPAIAPANAKVRMRWMAGWRRTAAWGIGARSTCRTSGSSTAIGPPFAPLRRPSRTTTVVTRPTTCGSRWIRSSSDDPVIGRSPTRLDRKRIAPPPTNAAR